MTDKQLDELEAWVAEHCIGRSYDLIAVITDYRRLRELDRACKAIRGCKNLRLTVTAPAPEYQVWGDSIATIGRLLEGEKGE